MGKKNRTKRETKKLVRVIIALATTLFVGLGSGLLALEKNKEDISKDLILGTISGAKSTNETSKGQEKEDKSTKQEKEYKVISVVDGDTLKIDFDGKEERLRLIGVDTPESVHPDKNRNTPYGKISSQYTKDFISNSNIKLEFDVQQRDKYGRLLAYVYVREQMLNKELVKNGHAKVATFPPNVKYKEDFVRLQEEARNKGLGLWKAN